MPDKKREVRRYVVRTRLFSLREPRRNAEQSNGVVGHYEEKPPSAAPATQGKPKG